jgi:hypothetical protein
VAHTLENAAWIIGLMGLSFGALGLSAVIKHFGGGR